MEKIWRCVECKKWSTAKKRPTFHKRWIDGESVAEPPKGSVVIETVQSEYSHMAGFISYGGWFVRCGPFEPWFAYPRREH